MKRSVVWFSCGASSAVAAKYAVKKYDNCEVVYCDTGGEHSSNKQFLKDCEDWIGKDITILKNEKYEDHFDVFEKEKYLYGHAGSRCTLEQLNKNDCLGIIWQSGIKLPKLYDMGYDHNNCIGCIKGGMGYWNKIRKDFPGHFKRMAKIERDIGHSRFRDMDTNERIWLDELPEDAGNFKTEPPISCDLSCGIAMNELEITD